MTRPISTLKDIDVTIPSHRGFLKKPFRYCEKTIIVIHEEIVKQLEINEETWVEQEVTDNGILLRITAFLKK